MSNLYYTPTGTPTYLSRAVSATARNESALIEDGFDKLPAPATLAGSGQNYAVDVGAVNALVVPVNAQISAPYDGMEIVIKAKFAPTAAATITVGGFTTRSIVRADGGPIQLNDWYANQFITLRYDATNTVYQLQSTFATTGTLVTPVSDAGPLISNAADPTKLLRLSASNLTTGTTRVINFSDQDFTVFPYSVKPVNRATNTVLGVNDIGTFFIATASFTQTLAATSTLGNGWFCFYRAAGGNVTFDPNASENIDGALTGILEDGMTIMVLCNGTGFDCHRIGTPIQKVLTSGTSGTWPLGVRRVKWRQGGAGGSGAKSGGAASGGPGAAGGYLEKSLNVSPNTGYTYAIGTGGASQTTASTDGNVGGSTTLTYNAITYTTTGGDGGKNSASAYANGGTATNGDINIAGGRTNNTGPIGFLLTGANPLGCVNMQGGGLTPTNGFIYSSGGDGATSAQSSGTGAQGVIILEY